MRFLYPSLSFISYVVLTFAIDSNNAIDLRGTSPPNASAPIPEAFVSFSVEFSSFPDFAGKHGWAKLANDL